VAIATTWEGEGEADVAADGEKPNAPPA